MLIVNEVISGYKLYLGFFKDLNFILYRLVVSRIVLNSEIVFFIFWK